MINEAVRTIAAAAILERKVAAVDADHSKIKSLPRGAYQIDRRSGLDRRA